MATTRIKRKRPPSNPSKQHDRVCVQCGGQVAEERANRIYCSDACKQAAYRARQAAKRTEDEHASQQKQITQLRLELRRMEHARQRERDRAEQAYAERDLAISDRRWAEDRAAFWKEHNEGLLEDLAAAEANAPSSLPRTPTVEEATYLAEQERSAEKHYSQMVGVVDTIWFLLVGARAGHPWPMKDEGLTEALFRRMLRDCLEFQHRHTPDGGDALYQQAQARSLESAMEWLIEHDS